MKKDIFEILRFGVESKNGRGMIKFLLLLLLTIPLLVLAETPKGINPIHPILNIKKDTVFVIQQITNDNVAKNYEQILEKTNNQLSLWWNPYGLLISILGILFTILTIISAVIIYRQSREHRELLKESITQYETILNQLIDEKNTQLKSIDHNLANLIAEQKEKLKSADAENKKVINELISKLEIQKDSIDTKISPTYVIPEQHNQLLSSTSLWQNKHYKCSKCSFGYLIREYPMGSTIRMPVTATGYGSKTVTCPKCANVEIYSSY